MLTSKSTESQENFNVIITCENVRKSFVVKPSIYLDCWPILPLFLVVVFCCWSCFILARVEWNSINIRPLTYILQANLFRNRSSALVVSNMITLLLWYSFRLVHLILDCKWSSKIWAEKKHRIFYAVVQNKVKCYTMRCDAMYDFLLSRLPCNYRATVLFDFTLLAKNSTRKTKESNKQTVLPSKSKPFDCWRIWHKII